MWPVLLGAIVGGVFTLLGGVAGQVRQDRRARLGAAQLLSIEMFLNAHAISAFLEIFERDPEDEEAVAEARQQMVAHCSTAVWRDHAPKLVPLLAEDFRMSIVSTYAALIRNETVAGHHHAASEYPVILEEAQKELEPHAHRTWADRHLWRF